MALIEARTVEAKVRNLRGFQILRGHDTPGGEGPYNMMSAAIHGDELPGIAAANRLVPHMRRQLEQGTIIFAWGNLDAMGQGVRGDPNLNRMFLQAAKLSPKERASTAYARAQELKIPLQEGTPVQALLDLHGTSNPQTTPHYYRAKRLRISFSPTS